MDILNRAVNMTAQSPFDQQKNALFLALQVSENVFKWQKSGHRHFTMLYLLNQFPSLNMLKKHVTYELASL